MLENIVAFFYALLRGLGFLTRLPVGKKYFVTAHHAGSDAGLYPLVGGLIGAVGALVFFLSSLLGFSYPATSLFATAAIITITGGLHEDGLSDVADGFFAPKAYDASARLDIMKDSHIGVFGVLALILMISLRVVLLADIVAKGGVMVACLMLILGEAVSRAGMVALWPSLPNVREHSIAQTIGAPCWRDAWLAILIGFFILLTLSFIMTNFMLAIIVPILLGAAVFLFRVLCRHKIGGLCGDVLGAAQQIGVVAILAAGIIVF